MHLILDFLQWGHLLLVELSLEWILDIDTNMDISIEIGI